MTPDPITAALQQLADHHEQLTQLTDLITGIGDTLREHAAALAKLAETASAGADPDRYRPEPATGVVEARGRRPPGTHRPAAGLGASRSTAPATATWPPPSAPAGPPTTCACTAWTSCPACGRCSTSSPSAPRGCCRPRPNTRPASCPPWPPS